MNKLVVGLTVALASFYGFGAETAKAAPVSTVPVKRVCIEGPEKVDWWAARLERNKKAIAASKGRFDLVFFGDSITHFWETNGSNTYARLQKKYSILNLGYAGDTTENLVWRGLNGELDGYKAKCVMLLAGANNIGRRFESAENIVAGLKRIIEVIREKQPQAKVVLLTLFPLGATPEDPWRKRVMETNVLVRKLAKDEKVDCLDLTDKFIDKTGGTKWVLTDTVHPDAKGYADIWYPAVEPIFRAAVGR